MSIYAHYFLVFYAVGVVSNESRRLALRRISCLKFERSSPKDGFVKSKFTVSNLVTFLDFVTLLVRSHLQINFILIGFRNSFNVIPHKLLLHKIINYGLSPCYFKLSSQLSNKQAVL